MKDTKFRILLDIHEVRSQATIPVKVGDVSCKIYITLVEGGKPYKIHENSFGVFTGKKGDNNPIFNNCIIENGIIRYDFTPQTVAAAGVLECEIRIYDEDGGVLTTPSFNIVVDERAVNDSELASESEFAFLDEILVNEGQRIENERNRNEAFNKLGIDLEDDGEVISIVKTDIDGSQEKASFLKYADVIPPVTATATGSAITIDSANAPLQSLKVYGKTTQDGTPTPTEPKELKSVGDSGSFEVGVYGKNLLDINKCLPMGKNEKITISNDNIIIGAGSGLYGVYWNNTFLEVGKTYTFSASNISQHTSAYGFRLSYEDGSYSSYSKAFTQTITITKPVKYFSIYIGSTIDTTTDTIISNVQVELGTQRGRYEPYTKQSITLTDTLRGVGEVADEVDFARGVTIQRFGIVDLGTLKWTYESAWDAFATNTLPQVAVLYPNQLGTELCSHYKTAPNNQVTLNGEDKTMCIGSGSRVWVIDRAYTDATTFKSAVSGVMLIYELATPIETPLSETELNAYRQLYTNKGNTTILSEADMEVDYYINKPNAQAIGNIHSQVNKDYFKLQQAIISTGGN